MPCITEDASRHGRKPNQKLKPYLVLQYLLKYTDEDHPADAYRICDYLQELGIDAERRSIYSDIEEINKVLWMEENDGTLAEAAVAVQDDCERAIAYCGKKDQRGYYVRQRHFELNDIRLLAECVYAAKFIPQSEAVRLADLVCEHVSKAQADKIKYDALVVDRVKTINRNTLLNISILRDAMAETLDGAPHTPEKVSFKYMAYQIGNLEKPVERRRTYIVSPYHLLIDNGNYYLLAFDDSAADIRTFRVDRMKDIRFEQEPRAGEEVFRRIDVKTYTQRVFSMYGGEKKRVQLRFVNHLLDTVIDRFGAHNAVYFKSDDNHFTVIADVEISSQFYAWVCGFGKKVRIETPDVAEGFAAYLEAIKTLYES